MQATSATFLGRPRSTRLQYCLLMTGCDQIAESVAIYRALRTSLRPPAMVRLPRICRSLDLPARTRRGQRYGGDRADRVQADRGRARPVDRSASSMSPRACAELRGLRTWCRRFVSIPIISETWRRRACSSAKAWLPASASGRASGRMRSANSAMTWASRASVFASRQGGEGRGCRSSSGELGRAASASWRQLVDATKRYTNRRSRAGVTDEAPANWQHHSRATTGVPAALSAVLVHRIPPDRSIRRWLMVCGRLPGAIRSQHDPTTLPGGKRYAVLDFPNSSIPTKTLATNIPGEESSADSR
jgi:hypothetical protein